MTVPASSAYPPAAEFLETQEVLTGEANYAAAAIPPLVWNGFRGRGSESGFVPKPSNHSDDSDDNVRLDPFNDSNACRGWPRHA